MKKKSGTTMSHSIITLSERIFVFRNTQVIVDKDLAELYGVETKRINEQVKRNIERFPERYRFELDVNEKNELVANCDRFKTLKHSSVNPSVFTEQGVAMLATVLHSEIAIQVSIQIIDTFVALRNLHFSYSQLQAKMSTLECKQVEIERKILQLFNKETPKEGVFFNGQIFDAYVFVSDLIKKANKRIVLIDNYIDESVFILFAKRKDNVLATIYTQKITEQLLLDLQKYNEQYAPIEVKIFKQSHDRFLIIDDELYLIGASIKDLGKKWFGFSKIESFSANSIMGMLEMYGK